MAPVKLFLTSRLNKTLRNNESDSRLFVLKYTIYISVKDVTNIVTNISDQMDINYNYSYFFFIRLRYHEF